MLLMSKARRLAYLTDLQTDELNALEIHLIQTDLPPLEETTLADLEAEEADFSGYAAKTAVDMDGPLVDDSGRVKLISPNQLFTHNGGGTANTIYGYYVTNAGNTVLEFWEKFETPQAMVNNGDACSFVARFGYDAPTDDAAITE